MGAQQESAKALEHSQESQFKGSGYGSGTKRSTGKGPRPARHIPWPEIFKHHISVVEGHLKMVDMVRKHTVPESGNWRTCVGMVDRCHEMLRMTKNIQRDFVPPTNQRDQVPIGSSSASMYPGYSPADHVYGKAAEEFGKEWAEAKKQGYEFESPVNGPEIQIGHTKAGKWRNLAQIREVGKANVEEVNNSSSDGAPSAAASLPPQERDASGVSENVKDLTANGENPYFIVDTNPTPVDLRGVSGKNSRRYSGEETDQRSKKLKTKHERDADAALEPKVEYEDLTEKVDARMKDKEKKRRLKEKKRKRESNTFEEGETKAAPGPATENLVEKPKKKKNRKSEVQDSDDSIKGSSEKKKNREAEEAEKKKKKKKKKQKENKD